MAIHVLADHIAGPQGFEPQHSHNFALEVTGLPGGARSSDLLTLSLASAFLPECANEVMEIPYGNERVWAAGKATWNQGSVVVRDYVDRPVAELLYQWRKQVYDPESGRIGLAKDYKKRGSIIMFGPNSTDYNEATFERVWDLHGLWPVSVNFAAQGLDMGSSNQVLISVNLRFDKAFGNLGSLRA